MSRQPLTARQRGVMTLIALGLRDLAIAERLCISPWTVQTHVGNAMGRLGACTRAQAVAIALVTGQVSQESILRQGATRIVD